MKQLIHKLFFLCLLCALTACTQQAGGKQAFDETLSVGAEEQAPLRVVHEPDSVGYLVRVGDMAPDFTIALTEGREVTLSSLRGKVVLLQFTASWCGVCRKEMPHIESDIWQKHKENPEFFLIGVDRDEPLETVIRFGYSVGVTYPLGLDPGADIFALYAERTSGITRNVLIDRDGRIVMLTRLFNEEEFQALTEKINSML